MFWGWWLGGGVCWVEGFMWGWVVVGGRLIDERDECVLPQSEGSSSPFLHCQTHYMRLTFSLSHQIKDLQKVRKQTEKYGSKSARLKEQKWDFRQRNFFFFQWSFIVVAFGNVRKIIDWLMFFIIVHEVRFWIYLGFNPIIKCTLATWTWTQ